MKKLALILIAATALHADLLTYGTAVENLQNDSVFDATLHWHPMLDSNQAILNGRITAVNFSDTLKFQQKNIDSTATLATDWMWNYTKRLWSWSNGVPQLRSGRGLVIFLNDTTTNSQPLVIASDSTDTLALFYPDSTLLKKPVVIDSIVTAEQGVFDSIKIGGGTWVKEMDIGGFVMKITEWTDTTQVVYNDSAHFFLVNDKVGLSVDLSGETGINSLSNDSFYVSILPENIRPGTERTIYLPLGVYNDAPTGGPFDEVTLAYVIPTTGTKGKLRQTGSIYYFTAVNWKSTNISWDL